MSAPGLSLSVILKMTKIELELIPDLDMYIFFDEWVRGRISYISNRYSKTNNKYLKRYDPKQESKHIVYFHGNNSYCYAISKFIPTSEFRWIDPK